MRFPQQYIISSNSIARPLFTLLCLSAFTFNMIGQTLEASDKGQQAAATLPPCSNTKYAFSGDGRADGPDGNIRTFTDDRGQRVKASAFSRRKSGGLWETAFLGAFDSGLGVTDGSEGNGGSNSHKLDNIGERLNYVLLEFDRSVVIDAVFLDSVGADSDMTAWVGNANDPFNNHLTLSDSLLNSFGSEDDNGSNGESRLAEFNAAGEIGNVVVIAASTSDTSPEDEFKIGYFDAKCPTVPPGTVTIIKQVQTVGGGTSSTQSFPFTASSTAGSVNFSLVDNNVVGPDRVTSNSIFSFGTANAITATEAQIAGWTLLDIICTETGGTQNTTVNLGTRSATIIVESGESVVCTFRNGQITPSAADAVVSGRIVRSSGRAISGATVTLTNLSTGAIRYARSSTRGYYSFEGIETTEFYSLTVSDRRYVFAPDTQFFTLNDSVTDADFVAQP